MADNLPNSRKPNAERSSMGEDPCEIINEPKPPFVESSEDNRGKAAKPAEGAAIGSGAGAGGGGGPEDYDDDAPAGGGRFPTRSRKSGIGADAPTHNSR